MMMSVGIDPNKAMDLGYMTQTIGTDENGDDFIDFQMPETGNVMKDGSSEDTLSFAFTKRINMDNGNVTDIYPRATMEIKSGPDGSVKECHSQDHFSKEHPTAQAKHPTGGQNPNMNKMEYCDTFGCCSTDATGDFCKKEQPTATECLDAVGKSTGGTKCTDNHLTDRTNDNKQRAADDATKALDEAKVEETQRIQDMEAMKTKTAEEHAAKLKDLEEKKKEADDKKKEADQQADEQKKADEQKAADDAMKAVDEAKAAETQRLEEMEVQKTEATELHAAKLKDLEDKKKAADEQKDTMTDMEPPACVADADCVTFCQTHASGLSGDKCTTKNLLFCDMASGKCEINEEIEFKMISERDATGPMAGGMADKFERNPPMVRMMSCRDADAGINMCGASGIISDGDISQQGGCTCDCLNGWAGHQCEVDIMYEYHKMNGQLGGRL